MMKKSFFALLACALVFACQPDDPEKGKKPQDDEKKPGPEVVDYTPQPGTYTFVMPEYTVKSAITSYGKTTWEAGDKIYIHGNYNPSSIIVTLEASNISADGKSATVDLQKVPSTGAAPDKLYAAYPADNVEILASMCDAQTRFLPSNDMLMTAYLTEGNKFAFQHITGAIAFSVSEPCDSFVVVGNASEELVFDYLVSQVTSLQELFRQDVGEGHRFYRGPVENGGGIANLPVKTAFGEKGFNLYLKKGDTYPKVYRYNKAVTISHGNLLDLGDITASLEDYAGPAPVEPIMPVMGTYEKITVKVEELSGICLTAEKDALWAVGDQGQLAKVGFDGTVTNIKNFNNDLEAITLNTDTGDLYIAAEGSQKVYRCSEPYTSYTQVFKVQEAIDGNYGNSGLEGIAYYGNGVLYVGSQVGANLWKYTIEGEKLGDFVSLKKVSSKIIEVGGLCYDPVNDWLWVTDSESHRVHVLSGDATTLLASYRVPFAGNNESVCVDHERGLVYIGDDDDNSPSIFKVKFTGLKPEDRQ